MRLLEPEIKTILKIPRTCLVSLHFNLLMGSGQTFPVQSAQQKTDAIVGSLLQRIQSSIKARAWDTSRASPETEKAAAAPES